MSCRSLHRNRESETPPAGLSNPSGATVLLGGVSYAVDVDGKRIYSKKATGQFPDESDLLIQIQRLAK